MKANDIHYSVSISGRDDGTLEAVYITLRDGKVDHTDEAIEDILLCDYDRAGNLLGIEVLAPVKLSAIVKHVPRTIRPPFQRFARQAMPQRMVACG